MDKCIDENNLYEKHLVNQRKQIIDSLSNFFLAKKIENMEAFLESTSLCLKAVSETNSNNCSFQTLLKAPDDFLKKPTLLKPESLTSTSKNSSIKNVVINEPVSVDALQPERSSDHKYKYIGLLTPDCFLSNSSSKSNIKSKVQILPAVVPPLSPRQECSLGEMKSVSSHSKEFSTKQTQKLDSKDNEELFYLSSGGSVRRKLNFDCSNPSVAVVSPLSSSKKEKPELNAPTTLKEIDKIALTLFSHKPSVDSQLPNELSNDPLARNLPSIGVFWDIENCAVPRGIPATHVVQAIRNKFFHGYKEGEFLCVCNTLKEPPKVMEELNKSQVNVIHVGSAVKNAADDKLLQSMRRFADTHGSGSAIVVISGDSDFATELYDLRYRKNIHIILVHNLYAQDCLKLSAHETFLFSELTDDIQLPAAPVKTGPSCWEFTVWNLPKFKNEYIIKRRLTTLANNNGGKVVNVNRESARFSFPTPEAANRAKKRIDGEEVCGNRIICLLDRISNRNQSAFQDSFVKEDHPRPTDRISTPIKRNNPYSCSVSGPPINSFTGPLLSRFQEPAINTFQRPVNTFLTLPVDAFQGPHVNNTFQRKYENTFEKSVPILPGCMNSTTNPADFNELPPVTNIRNPAIVYQEPNSVLQGLINSVQKTTVDDNKTPSVTDSPKLRSVAQSSFSANAMDHPSWRPQSPSQMFLSNGHSVPSGTLNSQIRDPSPQPLYLRKTLDSMNPPNQGFNFAGAITHPNSNGSYFADCQQQLDAQRSVNTSPLWLHSTDQRKKYRSNSPIVAIHNQNVYGMANLSVESGTQEPLSCTQIPVDLRVTNLDQTIDARDIKKILLACFREHVMVLHVSVFVQSDGTLAACVRVTSQHNAQYAISQLHRKKIGNKRIIISQINENSQPQEMLRAKVVNLLREVPGRKLLLFKFRELYERRYNETVGVPDLYNMKDIITVSDNSTGRTIYLHSDLQHQHPLSASDNTLQDPNELRYCKTHSSGPDQSVGWAERDHTSILPDVNMPLKEISSAMQMLLDSHGGSMPLASLVECYASEIGPLNEGTVGVPLEHLVSCINWVTIFIGPGGFKYIQWADAKDTDEAEELSRSISPPLLRHLSLFSKELVELLKTFPFCRLVMSRFIPAYHHHFGRQCRVADYGFTKLIDLFDALSHVVQIIGEGNKRILTLAHKAQVKRFSSDLLRVLKGQPSKIIALKSFPEVYEKIFEKPWNVFNYGICEFEDLLSQIGETTVIFSKTADDELTIAIPKREQTPEEIERTRQFATEVIELLKHSLQCKMQFNRFIPAYHHHFGRQCRVANYGFTKLIELFEVIPDVLQIMDDEEDGGKVLQLVEKERLKVLGEQVVVVVKSSPNQTITLLALSRVFTRYYGFSLKPDQYDCNSLLELIRKLRNHVEVEEIDGDLKVSLVDRSFITDQLKKVRDLLWDEPSCSLSLMTFKQLYSTRYNEEPNFDIIKKDLEEYMTIEDTDEDGSIKLVSTQVFARDLLIILHEAGGRMLLINLDTAYLDRFGVACRPAACGFPNLVALMQSLREFVSVKGRGAKRILVLNKEFADSIPKGSPPPPNFSPFAKSKENDHYYAFPCAPIPVPPPTTAGHLTASRIQTPTDRDHLSMLKEHPNSHMLLGLTPPRYQPPSPMQIYPGSPVNSNGSVMWSQLWSPQYSVIPSMSPHYMMPTIPINWGAMGSTIPSPTASNIPSPENPTSPPQGVAPISIYTLDQFDKVPSGPPNPSELPEPKMLKQSSLFPSEASKMTDVATSSANDQNDCKSGPNFDAKED